MSEREEISKWNPIVEVRGRRVTVELTYPTVDDNCHEVEVGLMDVRAADSILVRYDFERDGWVILQASTFEWEASDPDPDPDWQEVAFIEAWAREKPFDATPPQEPQP